MLVTFFRETQTKVKYYRQVTDVEIEYSIAAEVSCVCTLALSEGSQVVDTMNRVLGHLIIWVLE